MSSATAASSPACGAPTGDAKPAYAAFRLPLAAEAYGRSDVLWGRVRPLPSRTKVTILASPRKGSVPAAADGHDQPAWRVRAAREAPRLQRYRVRWTAPDGKVWLGPPIRAS